MTSMWIIKYATIYFYAISAQSFFDQDPLEIMDVRNDAVTIQWYPPQDIVNQTTKQRLMITVVRSSLQASKSSITINVNNETRIYTFTNLTGNTTYRVSVEAFEKDNSLWYASNMVTTSLASLTWLPAPTDITLLDKTNTSLEISWMLPVIQNALHSAIINQHLITVYEFLPVSKQLTKKFSINVPVPKTTHSISKLSPGCVYNITLQAGTNYGYGNMGWAVFSTLEKNEEEFILKQRSKTPNSLTLIWPTQWLPSNNAKFTIRAKTLHSPDNIEKDIMNSGVGEPGKHAEFVLRNLHPGSTYNVSITTFVVGKGQASLSKGRWASAPHRKTAWGVFSTLTQGAHAVGEPRIVVETETATSIVFHPLKYLSSVTYQVRYTPNEGGKPYETKEYTESELV